MRTVRRQRRDQAAGTPAALEAAGAAMTVIVRLFRDERGRLTGVVERPRTGQRRPLRTLDGAGRVIAELLDPSGARAAPARTDTSPRPPRRRKT